MTHEAFNLILAIGGAPAVIAAVGYTARRRVYGQSLIPWNKEAQGGFAGLAYTKEQVNRELLADSNAH